MMVAIADKTGLTPLQQSKRRFDDMKREYDSWRSAHKDLAQYINQKRGQFEDSRTNRGKMIDHQIILDGHATRSAEILASGLSSGMTNKAQSWFKPTVENPDIAKVPQVNVWLDNLQQLMESVLEGSNFYGVATSTYEEIGIFGIGCYLVLEDYKDLQRYISLTIGSYFLSIDAKGRVNGFSRKFHMQVGEMVKEFGLESVSAAVKNLFEQGKIDEWRLVCHLIQENKGRDTSKEDYGNMAYRSCYWEDGGNEDRYLAERGYKKFRVIAPRWKVTQTDQVYGYAPGWYALGDVKQLQKTTLDKLLAQEKLHNPPMQEDSSVEHSSYLPGGVSKSNSSVPNAGVRPAYQINPDLESFIELISGLKDSIDKFFSVNLFLMLMNVDKTQMTATEVAERQQEKVMMMGPILHKLDEEMLTPTLEILYEDLQEAGLIPEPPQEIQGMKIQIQYISILAQAQRALGIDAINRVIGVAEQIVAATQNPGSVSILDTDEILKEVVDFGGASAKIIKAPEVVKAERDQAAKMQQAQAAAEAAKNAAGATKDLAGAPMGQGSALDGLLQGAQK